MLTFCSATIYLCPEKMFAYFICGNNGFVNILSQLNYKFSKLALINNILASVSVSCIIRMKYSRFQWYHKMPESTLPPPLSPVTAAATPLAGEYAAAPLFAREHAFVFSVVSVARRLYQVTIVSRDCEILPLRFSPESHCE